MASEYIKDLTAANFDKEVAQSAIPVVVDFWAPWCGPCKAIAPMLEEMAKENVGKFAITKVNVDDNPDLAGTYNVQGIPTLLVFKGGVIKDQMVGAVSKRDLLAKVTAHL